MRAILAGSDTAGQNLNLVIAESIIYSVGFFGLLYSAYTLVLDREHMLGERNYDRLGPIGLVLRLISNRKIIRLALTAAVALGITAGSMLGSTQQSTLNTANGLRKASICIFLAVSACLILVAAHLAYDEIQLGSMDHDAPMGRKYRIFVLLAIAFLCLTREAFYAATENDVAKQDNAHLWYPLSALTELLAVMLFSVPGLVPSRREIAGAEQLKTQDSSSQTELNRFNV